MAKVQLEHRHVALGQPLPFDLVDEHGRVWLKYGYLLHSQGQLDRLVERGVFFEEVIDETSRQQQAAESVSVYLRLSDLAGEFEELLGKEVLNCGAVLDIAERIQELCELDGDAALANIQLFRSRRYSLRHAFHTAVMAEVLLKRLDRPQEIRLYAVAGALTMNVCMLELQDELYRQNTPLTLDQKRALVLHPQKAAKLLRERGVEHPVWLDVAEHHHEMIDGSGYAKRLLEEDLSVEAQAVSLADRYCAMVSEREYRAGVLPSVAAKDLLTRQAATVEPGLAAAFTREIGIYPPGTLVLLANGEVAVVVMRLSNPHQPIVRSLRSPSGIRYEKPPKRLTSGAVYAIKEAVSADTIKNVEWADFWSSIQTDEAEDGVVNTK